MIRLAWLVLLLSAASTARPDGRLEAAIQALRADPSLKVRTQAAIVLGQRGAAEAVPALRQAVAEDGAVAVRLAAVGALSRMGARVSRPTLKAASEADPDASVRTAASRALDGLGPVTLTIEEPGGTASTRAAARASLERQLTDLGFPVADAGELRLKPTVTVDVSERGGKTVIAVKASLVVVDGDGHMDMLESTAKASVTGAVPEAKLAGYSTKAVDAALRSVCEDLAARLGRR
jgi:hypothetical protein